MFAVSVVDQVRLSFGHVVQNYTLHARKAERLAALGLKVRLAVLALLALATSATVLSLFRGHAYQIAAAVLVGLALVSYSTYVAANIETRTCGHRALAHRLWLQCERHRSLLAEAQDGLLDTAAILERRDVLIKQVHAIYEQEFPVDQAGLEAARQLPAEAESGGVSEHQIDRYLPVSTRRDTNAESPAPPVPHITPHARTS
jgi:SMODS and SLOG-associating 2TM effector domain family 4